MAGRRGPPLEYGQESLGVEILDVGISILKGLHILNTRQLLTAGIFA